MKDLIRTIMYGKQKAKAMKEMDNATLEMSRYCAWLSHLEKVYRTADDSFCGMRELIEECPNKGVRDLFIGILDEWNQMRAERLHIVAEDYYDRRVEILLGQGEVLAGAYDGVQTLLDILEWYMNK